MQVGELSREVHASCWATPRGPLAHCTADVSISLQCSVHLLRALAYWAAATGCHGGVKVALGSVTNLPASQTVCCPPAGRQYTSKREKNLASTLTFMTR
jgi:hypothetical protein